MQTVTNEEMYYTSKELFEFSNLYKQKYGEHVLEWVLKVQDNGGRNINLDYDEFIDIDSFRSQKVL